MDQFHTAVFLVLQDAQQDKSDLKCLGHDVVDCTTSINTTPCFSEHIIHLV